MTTSEIRDEMLKRKTLYEQSLITAEKSAKEIQERLALVEDETIHALMRRYGIDISWIRNIDYQRIKTDTTYRNQIAEKQEGAIQRLHNMLEEALDVQH